MTGVRILSVVTLGSLHWTHAAGQGVVTDFVLVDSGSDAVWLRLPESVAGSPNGGPESWQEFQLGGESENTDRAPPVVEGELKLWRPVTVPFDGSYVTESSDPNPLLDYRLNVTLPRKARAFDRGAQPCQRAVLLSPGDPGHCACESYAVVEMIKVGGQLSTMPWND